MSKSVNKFHYVDADGNDTSPEMATRITLLVYDEKQKISKRIDWKRDDANTSENCNSQLEKDDDVMFTRTDAIENMKEVIAKLMDEFKKAGMQRGTRGSRGIGGPYEMSAIHKIQDLARLLIGANEKLDEMIWRIFNEKDPGYCDGENCNHGE